MRVAIGLFMALAFATAMYFATLAEAGVQCEVCLRFAGRLDCRKAAGADEEAAVRGAINNASPLLANGVTQSMRCNATPPESVRCEP